MPFIYLLLLALIHLRRDWPEPPAWLKEQGDVAFIQIVGSMVFIFLAMGLTQWFCHLLQKEPDQRLPLFHDFQNWKQRHNKAFLVFFLLSSYQFGWGWSVQQLYQPTPTQPIVAATDALQPDAAPPAGARPNERIPMPGFEAVFLAPFLLGLVASWLFFYRFDRMAHDLGPNGDTPFVRRGAYLLHLIRQHFLLLVLPLCMMIGAECLAMFVQVPDSAGAMSANWIAVSVALSLAFVATIPWLLRLFLGLKPLPEGPLRDRLTATARRIHLRFSDILLWKTRNSMANAMVTGVLPWLRYVVVTDRLLNELHEEEIQAVFGHEAGHVRHHHMAFYILFLMASIALMPYLWTLIFTNLAIALPRWKTELTEVQNFTEIGLIAGVLYIFVVFGYLSRRCERQADLFGAEVASPEAFILALEKVAAVNGIPMENPGWFSSWQHSTIARRIDFVKRTITDPTLAPTFQRRFALLKWTLTIVLVAGAITAALMTDGMALLVRL